MAAPVRELSTQEKLADFYCLYDVFRDNHPYLGLKARVEGFDWLSYRSEYEDWIRASRNNEEFAQAMWRIVTLVNNGHTSIVNGRYFDCVGLSPKPWAAEASKTSREAVAYWFALAAAEPPQPQPFVAQYSAGEYVVVDVAPVEGILDRVQVGSKVLAVNGVPVHQCVNARRGITWLPYDPLRKRCFQRVLKLGALGTSVRVALLQPDGHQVDVELPLPESTWSTGFQPIPWYGAQSDIHTAVIGGGKVGYVHVRQMSIDPASDEGLLRQFFESVKDLPFLIIDIRGNSGGNDAYWHTNIVGGLGGRGLRAHCYLTWRAGDHARPFAESKGTTTCPLIPESLIPAGVWPPGAASEAFDGPRDMQILLDWLNAPWSIGYAGKVFLLVDNVVFSASESFAAIARAAGWATLVGGCTGGDGLGCEPALLALPNSGMLIRFPADMGLNPDWTINEETHTRPDVLVEQSRDDLVKYAELIRAQGKLPGPTPQVDTCLRKCLEMCAGVQ